MKVYRGRKKYKQPIQKYYSSRYKCSRNSDAFSLACWRLTIQQDLHLCSLRLHNYGNHSAFLSSSSFIKNYLSQRRVSNFPAISNLGHGKAVDWNYSNRFEIAICCWVCIFLCLSTSGTEKIVDNKIYCSLERKNVIALCMVNVNW